METKKDPNPERFKTGFDELEDHTGFKLEGCDFVFRYDEADGWYDEFGNYFDKDGVPTTAPTEGKKKTVQEESKVDKTPKPERFKNFVLFEDKTAFAIEGSDRVFYFDKDGGWYDEFNNYYNHLGEPSQPPAGADEDDDDDDEDDDDFGYDDEEYDPDVDKLLDEYDLYDDEEYDLPDNRQQTQVILESEYENLENKNRIESYPEDTPIKIRVTNISFKGKMHDFKKLVQDTGAEIENFEYERYGRDSHTGWADFTVRTKKGALDAITLNGENFEGRRVIFTVLEFAAEDSEEEVVDEPQLPEQKDASKAFGETDLVQVLFWNINYGKTMEEFRKFLENEKKIKIEELKYKKYGKDSHRGEAAITVKGKKLVDEALKLHGAFYAGRKLDVQILGKVQEKQEPKKTESKPAEKKQESKEPEPKETKKNDAFFSK